MKLSAFCLVTILGAAILAGCSGTNLEDDPAMIEYGRDASAVTRARILGLGEEIAVLQQQLDNVIEQRDAYRKDALEYRKKSTAVWTDVGLTERQRIPMAKEYLELARDREDSARVYDERAKAINQNISQLDQQRQTLRARLDYLSKQGQALSE